MDKSIHSSDDTKKARTFSCICGLNFTSQKLKNAHTSQCDLLSSLNPQKRKADTGYHNGAFVSMQSSQIKFRRHVRIRNVMLNDRGVSRSSALHTRPTIPQLGSINVHEANQLVDDEEMMFDCAHDDLDEEERGDSRTELEQFMDMEDGSVSSVDGDDSESDNEEPEEDDEEKGWEDVPDSTVDDLEARLFKIKINHNRRWAKLRYGDGYQSGGHTKPFEYKNNLPPYYIAQVSLMKILSQHRGNDLKLFDRLMHWVGFFSDRYPTIWSKRMVYKNHTRKAIIPFLSDFFGGKELIPKKKTAEMCDGSKIDMPVYDFKAVFENMILDPTLVNEANLIQENFDPITWRPIKSFDELSPNDVVNDLASGSLYQEGINLYCNEDPPEGIARILPAPIIIFTDEAHHDKKNGNKTGPICMCPAMVKQEVRAKDSSWSVIAYLPNYGLGRGKYYGTYDDKWEVEDGRKRGKKTLTQKQQSMNKVKDHQTLYDTALQSFRDYCDTYGGVRMMWKGELCLVKPFLLMVIGDTKEYNMMVNSYNSCKVRCPSKDCLCTWTEFGTKFGGCERITLAHLQKAMEEKDYAKFISYHQEESVWNNLPIADIVEGIGGMCPLEWLHLNGQGNFKDGPDVLHDLIGVNQTMKSKKEELDLLFRNVTEDMKRNSERDIPVIAMRFAVMDLSNVTANERVGNYYILIICLSSKRGRRIMKKSLRKNNLTIEGVIDTMTALLAYDAWSRSTQITKWELDNAGPAVSRLMEDITINLPKEVKEGSFGYHKVKFHGLWLNLAYLRKYASARITSGEHGERLHKTFVGKVGDNTQKRPAKFTVQCGEKDGERVVVERSFRYLRHLCPVEQFYNSQEDENHTQASVRRGKNVWMGYYTLSVSAYSGRMRDVSYKLKWNSNDRTAAGIELHEHFLHCLATWAVKQDFNKPYMITGYTELRVQSDSKGNADIYRANDYYYGRGWYDWALVEDPKNADITYIGKIIGFFKYSTPGFPSYKHIEIDGRTSADVIASELKDDTMYMVVIGSKNEITEDELDQRIATHFRLTSGDEAYMLPIRCIRKPLLISRDFGSTTSTGYLHCMPQREWPRLFSRLITKAINKDN